MPSASTAVALVGLRDGQLELDAVGMTGEVEQLDELLVGCRSGHEPTIPHSLRARITHCG